MRSGHPTSQVPDVSVGHEERDIAARPIAYFALGIAGLCVFALVLMHVLFGVLATEQAERSAPASPLAESYGLKEPPEPRLQTNPRQDLLDLRARDGAAIHSYGWIDKQAGIVRIPVERAIALLAERGLPARPAAPKGQP